MVIYIILSLLALIALLLSLRSKEWTISLISFGLLASVQLFRLDPSGLLPHYLSISILSLISLMGIYYLKRDEHAKVLNLTSLSIGLFVLVLLFKLFHLQGFAVARWLLVPSMLTALYLIVERRKMDARNFIQAYLLASSIWILCL